MNYKQPIFNKCRYSLVLLVILAIPSVSTAERYEFRVVYAGGPAADLYEAGNLEAAIEVLESRLTITDNPYLSRELATLCGFYILGGKYDAARDTCSAAVETGKNGFAYNNRGVLRMRMGDTAGALEDFGHIKVPPAEQSSYIQRVTDGNERLVASRNYLLVTEYLAKLEERRTNKQTMAGAAKGANVEDVIQ